MKTSSIIKSIFTGLFFLIIFTSKAQYSVHTEDITNFWVAFDSVEKVNDKEKQMAIIQKLYMDKASSGLKSFMKLRDGNVEKWQDMMINAKEEMLRKRPYIESVLTQKSIIDAKLEYFKKLYPDFKQGDIYFTIGVGNSGGTTTEKDVLIGCEVVANEKPDWAVAIVIHEFMHTQQYLSSAPSLLVQTIFEGMADFVAELVNEKPMAQVYPNSYIDFGLKNETAIWESYKKYMFSNNANLFDWLYGSTGRNINGVQMKDLGYFMGYAFCKKYYENAPDKTKAIKEMLQIDLSSNEKARAFLLASGYVPKKDLAFVKNSKFVNISTEKANIKREIYGYKQTKDEMVFEVEIPQNIALDKVKSVSVAGSFNGWNPKNEAYFMQNMEGRKYQIHIAKSSLKKGEIYMFKFVINGDNWLPVPDKAKNVDGTSNNNLTFKF
jgi:hypothetical protein